jgi:septum formation protein
MNRRIILASSSPRRKDILTQIGLTFTIVPSEYEEDMSLDLAPEALAKTLSLGRAAAVAELHPDAVVIGADTLISFNGKVYGKPKSKDDARYMLQMLSGNMHEVITGISVVCKATAQTLTEASVSKVHFVTLSSEDIEDYIASGEPLDKAGSYAVQGRGARYIERIEGEYTGIVGLPASLLMELLKKIS